MTAEPIKKFELFPGATVREYSPEGFRVDIGVVDASRLYTGIDTRDYKAVYLYDANDRETIMFMMQDLDQVIKILSTIQQKEEANADKNSQG